MENDAPPQDTEPDAVHVKSEAHWMRWRSRPRQSTADQAPSRRSRERQTPQVG